TREGGVAAEIHFHRGSEPAQREPVALTVEERGLGEIHLPRHLPHPLLRRGPGEHTDRGGIPGEGPVGEGVHHDDGLGHGNTASASISTSISGSIRRVTSTMVAAGRISRKNSPCARPTSSHRPMSV